MTITQISEKLNVDETVTYNFVRFLESQKLVTSVRRKADKGARGHGKKDYVFDDNTRQGLIKIVAQLTAELDG